MARDDDPTPMTRWPRLGPLRARLRARWPLAAACGAAAVGLLVPVALQLAADPAPARYGHPAPPLPWPPLAAPPGAPESSRATPAHQPPATDPNPVDPASARPGMVSPRRPGSGPAGPDGTAPAGPDDADPHGPGPGDARPTRAARSGPPPAPSDPAESTPTSPAPEAISLSFEAEAATNQRTGTARPEFHPGASRGYVVTGVGGGPANLLRFAVVVPTTTEYEVTVYYVDDGGGHPVVIGANGRTGTAYTFADTAGSVGRRTVRLSLRAGVNTVEFSHPRLPTPRIDRLVIRLP